MFIMTHDKHFDGNIGSVYKSLKQEQNSLRFIWILQKDVRFTFSIRNIPRLIYLLFVKTYHLSRAKYVFLDNVFLPLAFLNFKKQVRVVQLWHGCGAIKKFGQDINTGYIARLEKKANQTYTHLVVNSEAVIQQHQTAFGIPKNKIYAWGLPRTDFYFDPALMDDERNKLFTRYPRLQNKKIILYSPTFRDHETRSPKLYLDCKELLKKLGDQYALVLRFHPFISDHIDIENDLNENIFDLSHYENLNAILVASDMLITDYSSIIYEYSLLNRPMFFFAYDLELYRDNLRGFYVDYDRFVPGPVVYTLDELISAIQSPFSMNVISEFRNQHFQWMDGQSTCRVVNNIILKN